MGVDSMHSLVFPTELQQEAKPVKNVESQKAEESTTIAGCPEGAQEGGGAAETCLLRVANQVPGVAFARVGGILWMVSCQGACCPACHDRRLQVWPHVQEEGGDVSEEVLDDPDDRSDILVSMWSTLRWKPHPHSHRWHRHPSFWFLS